MIHLRNTTLCLLLLVAPANAADWLHWRGNAMDGKSTVAEFPLNWSPQQNIKWKVPLSEPGNSTPIVVGDRVFITSDSANSKARQLICFNRSEGKELWRREVPYEQKELTHKTNPLAAASPSSDGTHVYVWFGSAGFHVYDLEGNKAWSKDLGEFNHIWGYAASPLVHGDLVIQSAGPGLRAFVVAMDKHSGEERWRFEPEESISKKVDEFRGSWSTPVVYELHGTPRLLLSLPTRLYALNPVTGAVIWSSGGPSNLVYTSPLVSEELVVTMSGYGGPSMAVRTGGEGDVTATHRLWLKEEKSDNPQRVGSGVLVNGHVYILNEPGIAWCIDAATGEIQWQERLGGTSWCSAVYAGGHIYVSNANGDTFVFKPNPQKYEEVAKNSLGELMRGSLAFSEGAIFARTYEGLYCISQE